MKLPLTLLLVLITTNTLRVHGSPVIKTDRTNIVQRGLHEDLQDFLQLVPKEKIINLFNEYLSEDEDFGSALDYIMSEEFKSLLADVDSMTEVKHLLQFLESSGLKAYEFINKIHDLLGIEHIHPDFRAKFTRITGGLPGFIADIKALLPINEIEKLYKEKLQTSEDFATLVKRLSSQEFQGLVDKLMANPKLQNLMKRAEAKGVDVQAILDLITSILGLKFPPRPGTFVTRKLTDDWNDFLKLVPREKISNIFNQYLSEDEDFGSAIDYVMSDEFKSLLTEVTSMSEVKDLLNFLESAGLHAYDFINKIFDLLGMEHIHPIYRSNFVRITGGLPGFIADVKALLPINEIEKLYKEKLQTSKDFATLVERLSSQEFQGLVDKLMANPKLQNLMKRAEAKGVDVQAILDLITSILGLKFPPRPGTLVELSFQNQEEVIDILRVIWSKVPMDDILDIILDYLIRDEDFKRVAKFMMKDEFRNIVDDIEEISEMKALFKLFGETGMDIYKWINAFHDLIGMEKRLPNTYTEITGGVSGLLEDIRSKLPLDELRDYYDNKMATSIKFKDFIHRLETQELQNAVNALGKHSGFNVLLNKLEALGVDWKKVTELISAIIGIKFPPRTF